MKPFLGIALAVLVGLALPAQAGEIAAGKAWARPTSAANQTGMAFLTLDNAGRGADSLIGASSPVAAKVEFHAHQHQDGLMKMQPQPSVELPAGQSVAFNPGGLHLMLVGLKAPLVAGQSFPVTLLFAKSGPVSVTVTVDGGGAMDHSMHHGGMDDAAHKAMHDEHMKDPAHKAMHEQMHGPGK